MIAMKQRASSMRSLLVGVFAATLSGCMVGPDYERPSAPESATFKEATGWKVAQPRDDAPRGPWWEPFADPELNRLASQVEVDNQTVAAAAAKVREAQAATQAARSQLFPAINVNGAALRTSRGSSDGAQGQVQRQGVTNSYNIALDLNWEIDLWGGIRRGVEASGRDGAGEQRGPGGGDAVDASAPCAGLPVAPGAGCRHRTPTRNGRRVRALTPAHAEPVQSRRRRTRRRCASRGAARFNPRAAARRRRGARATGACDRGAGRQTAFAARDRGAAARHRLSADSGRAAVRAPRAATGHRSGRTPHGERQRANRCCASGVLSRADAGRNGRLAEFGHRKPVVAAGALLVDRSGDCTGGLRCRIAAGAKNAGDRDV